MSWLVTDNTEVSSLAGAKGAPTSTAMMTSGRHSSRTTSIGKLLATPPSTSSLPFNSMGARALGMDMLARIAWARLPDPNTTARPVSRSVATAR